LDPAPVFVRRRDPGPRNGAVLPDGELIACQAVDAGHSVAKMNPTLAHAQPVLPTGEVDLELRADVGDARDRSDDLNACVALTAVVVDIDASRCELEERGLREYDLGVLCETQRDAAREPHRRPATGGRPNARSADERRMIVEQSPVPRARQPGLDRPDTALEPGDRDGGDIDRRSPRPVIQNEDHDARGDGR